MRRSLTSRPAPRPEALPPGQCSLTWPNLAKIHDWRTSAAIRRNRDQELFTKNPTNIMWSGHTGLIINASAIMLRILVTRNKETNPAVAVGGGIRRPFQIERFRTPATEPQRSSSSSITQ